MGDELRVKRTQARLGTGIAAERLGWSPSKLSKVEAGVRGTAEADIAALLTVCQVSGAEFQRLIALGREPEHDIWAQPIDEHGTHIRTRMVEESRATTILTHHPTTIPCLLRTPEYMAAAAHVDQPGERQNVLWRADTTCFVTEQALSRVVGSSRVTHDQLMHLLLVPTTVRIVPSTASREAFTLLGGETTVAYVETDAATVYLENAAHVARYERAVFVLSAMALGEQRSRALLSGWADEFA
ncbi:MAG: helix-turn-helix transcriptional regulator [Umezawaea sp.]